MDKTIGELAVHRLDGNFYTDTRRYLEKQGCVWREQRGQEGQLLSVHLSFPDGTTYKQLAPEEKRYWVTFPKGGRMAWSVKQTGNGITVPYVYL